MLIYIRKPFSIKTKSKILDEDDLTDKGIVGVYQSGLSISFLNYYLRRIIMFRWAIIFAVIALIASFLGFGGVAGLSANFAYILLAIAVILFIVAFVSRRM